MNSLKIVLAERWRTNKWLAEQLGERPVHCVEMVRYEFQLPSKEKIRKFLKQENGKTEH